MTSTILPGAPQGPLPAARPYVAHRPTVSPIVIAATALGVVGVVGGYATARYVDTELFTLVGLAWWLGSAITLALLVKRSPVTAAIVSLFLFLFVALPITGYAVARGLAQRVVAVIQEDFSDFTGDISENYEGNFGVPDEGLPPAD